MHFSGDNPVFLTSVKSLRKLLIPFSKPAVSFDIFICTRAAGNVAMNSAIVIATGMSITVWIPLMKERFAMPRKFVSSKKTTNPIAPQIPYILYGRISVMGVFGCIECAKYMNINDNKGVKRYVYKMMPE